MNAPFGAFLFAYFYFSGSITMCCGDGVATTADLYPELSCVNGLNKESFYVKNSRSGVPWAPG